MILLSWNSSIVALHYCEPELAKVIFTSSNLPGQPFIQTEFRLSSLILELGKVLCTRWRRENRSTLSYLIGKGTTLLSDTTVEVMSRPQQSKVRQSVTCFVVKLHYSLYFCYLFQNNTHTRAAQSSDNSVEVLLQINDRTRRNSQRYLQGVLRNCDVSLYILTIFSIQT